MTGYVKKTIKKIHEGRHAAEVEVTLHYEGDIDWSPTIGPGDIEKLDRVTCALRRGHVMAAATATATATATKVVTMRSTLNTGAIYHS